MAGSSPHLLTWPWNAGTDWQAGDRLLNVSVSDSAAAGEGTVSAFATTHADGSTAGVEGLQIFVTNFSPSKHPF
jgi:hypothetical protein